MDELRCNSLRCRKQLNLEGSAVVTTCSHIFCVACANDLFSTPQICPACETALPDNDDAVQTALNPPDAYKTSVLSGLSPIIIFDIASRALNFYHYQLQQEASFQALVTKNSQERIAVLEAQCQNIVREATSEINLLKERVTAAERDLELERRKVRELQETHKTNAKAYSKLKAAYDKASHKALANNTAFTNQAQPPQGAGIGLAQPQPQLQPQRFAGPLPTGTPIRGGSVASNRGGTGWNSNPVGPGTFTGAGHNAGPGVVRGVRPIGNPPRRTVQDQNRNLAGGGFNQQQQQQQGTWKNPGVNVSPRRAGSGGGSDGLPEHGMPRYLGQGTGAGAKSGFRPAGNF